MKPGRPSVYDASIDAQIINSCASGVNIKTIAAELDKTEAAIYSRIAFLRAAGQDIPSPVLVRKQLAAPACGTGSKPERRYQSRRPCMRCRNEFKSEGPHNRLCQRCKEAARHVSPYAP